MKIDSISNIGYSPVSQKEPSRAQKMSGNDQMTQISSGAPSTHNGLTSAERAFFAQLFPESSLQIHAHSTYSPSGVHSSVAPGQIINRKV